MMIKNPIILIIVSVLLYIILYAFQLNDHNINNPSPIITLVNYINIDKTNLSTLKKSQTNFKTILKRKPE